ncbi:ABC transporter ATP-binding protein [Ningiella sp. W23]|uniref:ABC transporter ATP-binding protein n=1 Tax=Ningiella sp. W23 TaxID=3023715 RepID=UPI003756C524
MLEVQSLSLNYDDTTVLSEVSFSLSAGEIACVLGPSGCGKTTLLQSIAGFHVPSHGQIHIDGQIVASDDTDLAPDKRGIGVVFQDFALFPHMSVQKNVEYGLHKLSADERKARALDMLERVDLAEYSQSFPHELSGGQQQRVAIARAVAPKPRLLLLDEPFSSLDPELRERLAVEIRNIIKRLGITALMVTHDQHEAFAMADKIGIFAHGHCQQWDTAYKLYHEPNTRFVADFIGEGVFVPGTVEESAGQLFVNTALGRLDLNQQHSFAAGQTLDVLIRPDDLSLNAASKIATSLTASVLDRRFRGASILYKLVLKDENQKLLCLAPSHQDFKVGERVSLRLDIEHCICFTKA